MPKNQSTAAQSARRASRSGGKYTVALRHAKTSEAPRTPHVLRFLAERSGNLYYLVGGIAAAWAHSGQRVLLLEEAEDYWRWTMSGVRRSRSRRKKENEPATPPEPTSSTLWASLDGPGLLTHHTCMWETRHPAQENSRGFPHTDRSPLAAAVTDAIDAYDVIVLLPRYWSYPDREIATAHVVLGEIDIFPDVDCRTALPGPGGEEKGVPLSPEQSAAVLRERCLGFLFGFPHLPITLDGVIWQSNWDLPVAADYLAGVDRDMNRAGLRPLGWSLAGRRPYPHKQLPEPDQMKDPSFVQQYRPIAEPGAGRPPRRQKLTRRGGADHRPDHEADHGRREPDHGSGRGVSDVTPNSNKRSNAGMDATDFPNVLVQTQAAWNATYQALAAPRPRDTTALRRRLLHLFVRLWWHPYWETVPSVPAARFGAAPARLAAGLRRGGRRLPRTSSARTSTSWS